MKDRYESTDEARECFKSKGLTYNDINEADIQMLYFILNRNIKKSVKNGETSVETMHMSKKVVVNKKRNGAITSAFLFVNSHYFTQRECVSFNKDGFIGFCGWADDTNTAPITASFIEWCDLMSKEVDGDD